jgi:DtxR family Mn-dependent transcriptional regulator
MAHLNTPDLPLSENIEMYLVRVAQLRQGSQPVPISQLAQELAVTSVSANEMCRKLVEKGLVEYEPYKGVTLTANGDLLVQRVLRSRHLWTSFFNKELGFPLESADELACRFEHVTPDNLADQLDAYLASCGIPPWLLEQQRRQLQAVQLSELGVGEGGCVSALLTEGVTNSFLRQQAIVPGAMLTVLGVGGNGALLIDVAGQPVALTAVVAQAIQVRPNCQALEIAKES